VLNGVSFSLTLDSRELADEILPRLVALPVPSGPVDLHLRILTGPEALHLLCGDERFATAETVPAARALLLQEMVRLSRRDRDWLALLHAGACGNGERCVIFPAASHSGKSTLAAVLLSRGFSLHSDDSVGVERDTLCIPVAPFALALRKGSWPLVGARFPEFEALPVYVRFGQCVRFLPPTCPASDLASPAAAIVFSRWHPGSDTQVRALDTLQTLVRLNEAGFWVAHNSASIADFLSWVESLPSHELIYSDADAAADFVAGLLA
jgi:hypothetical protein